MIIIVSVAILCLTLIIVVALIVTVKIAAPRNRQSMLDSIESRKKIIQGQRDLYYNGWKAATAKMHDPANAGKAWTPQDAGRMWTNIERLDSQLMLLAKEAGEIPDEENHG